MNLKDLLWGHYGEPLNAELIGSILHFLDHLRGQPIDVAAIPKAFRGEYAFSVERFADVVEEIKSLHRLHWDETEKHAEGIEMNPDYALYDSLDRCGMLMTFLIRHQGEVVGECIVKINYSMHTQKKTATEDALFLRKDHRGGGTAMAFVHYMVEVLREMDVSEVWVSSKLVNSADKFMVRAGFTPVATQLCKILRT